MGTDTTTADVREQVFALVRQAAEARGINLPDADIRAGHPAVADLLRLAETCYVYGVGASADPSHRYEFSDAGDPKDGLWLLCATCTGQRQALVRSVEAGDRLIDLLAAMAAHEFRTGPVDAPTTPGEVWSATWDDNNWDGDGLYADLPFAQQTALDCWLDAEVITDGRTAAQISDARAELAAGVRWRAVPGARTYMLVGGDGPTGVRLDLERIHFAPASLGGAR